MFVGYSICCNFSPSSWIYRCWWLSPPVMALVVAAAAVGATVVAVEG
jgi:hypothetical protein